MSANLSVVFNRFPLNHRVQVLLNRDSHKPEARWIDGIVVGHQTTRREYGTDCRLEVAVVVEKYGEPQVIRIMAEPSVVRDVPPAKPEPIDVIDPHWKPNT